MAIEFGEAERAAGEAFRRLARAADEFEAYAHPHAERLAALADALAAHFRLSRADRSAVVFAALLHDVGEMAMRRDYIRRPGPLNAAERLDLQRHPVIGEQEAARNGADRAVQLLVRWHQEWWSGAGYPDALRGEQIPLGARILRVADAYAALTDERPWRPAGTEAEARKHLTLWAGLEFDPQVVRAFLSLEGLPELRSLARPRREEAEVRVETTPPAEAEPVAAGDAPGENPWKTL
ncbi:MAG TPA: HD domain-containing phosphohydrolase [Pyrinomonadaceae bacterium]|jgi:HD-GYP domain-containing protein (c-di-GMP phosphodiesterase class II)|nr:HD domain-containing phosphohydrolase [Pyrinomonadaceae bacterium]